MIAETVSPHGGPVTERQALSARFSSRLATNEFFCRMTVSYQGNRKTPGLRWLKYKEGFSSQLVADLIEQEDPCSIRGIPAARPTCRPDCPYFTISYFHKANTKH